MTQHKYLGCVVVIVSLGLNVAAQQITGNIRGTIAAPSGAIVQAAGVTATQIETGFARTVATKPTALMFCSNSRGSTDNRGTGKNAVGRHPALRSPYDVEIE